MRRRARLQYRNREGKQNHREYLEHDEEDLSGDLVLETMLHHVKERQECKWEPHYGSSQSNQLLLFLFREQVNRIAHWHVLEQIIQVPD